MAHVPLLPVVERASAATGAPLHLSDNTVTSTTTTSSNSIRNKTRTKTKTKTKRPRVNKFLLRVEREFEMHITLEDPKQLISSVQ